MTSNKKKFNFLYNHRFFLLLILILSLILRIAALRINNRSGFFCDEASIGYNAYCLLTNGKDEYGKSWPVFYRAFGEYKNPVMVYSTMPLVALFGLTETSVRLTSVIYGILGVLALYRLSRQLVSKEAGLISALFLAISPWHIHLSGAALEGLMPFVFFTTAGTFFWLVYLKRRNGSFYTAITLFSLALYSYFPARIFIPLYCLGLIVLDIKYVLKDYQKMFLGTFLTLILILPMLVHLLFGPGMSRWHQVKSTKSAPEISRVYLAHFSPAFLFLKGDIDSPGQFITRHSIRGIGQFYLYQLPLTLIGLAYSIINKKTKVLSILILWLILYPLAGSFTDATSPQATRSVIGVIPFQVFSAVGVISFFNLIKKTKIQLISACFFVTIIFLSFFNFLKLWQDYPQYSADFWGWQFGPQEVMKYFLAQKNNYDQLCLEGVFNAPNIFLNFYDPKNNCSGKCDICSLESYQPKAKQLFAVSLTTYKEKIENRPNINFETQKIIYYPNNQAAFLIGKMIE